LNEKFGGVVMVQPIEQNAQDSVNAKPIDRGILRKAVHKHEMKLYVMAVVINVTIVLYLLVSLGNVIGNSIERFIEIIDEAAVVYAYNPEEGEILAYELGTSWGETLVEELSVPIIVVVIPFVLLITLYTLYAKVRAYSVKVTEKNFPEIYYKSVEFSKKLGLKKVPEVYIQQGNGVINAFAMAVFGRRISMLHAELVDVAYMEENKDFETVYFVLAHEFAHIYLNHVSIPVNLSIAFSRIIPIFSPAFSRAREYSCDKIAQVLTDSNGLPGIMVLSVGRRLYKKVDIDNYLDTVKKQKGFFLWYTNLMASHPIFPKRVAALTDPQQRSGKLF